MTKIQVPVSTLEHHELFNIYNSYLELQMFRSELKQPRDL